MKRLCLIPVLLAIRYASAAQGDDPIIPSLSLDEFVERAIHQGLQGKENEWSLQTAGYTREIAMRQTDSPSFRLTNTHSRGEVRTNGFSALRNADQTGLEMDETTPLGTTINANGQWATSGGTLGPSGTVAKPGFTANVTQPLYLFVKNNVWRARQIADLEFANAKDLYDSTVLTLRAQARSQYYTIMLNEESIAVQDRKVASSKKLLEVTQALVNAGKTAPVDTMRSKLTLQADERQLANAVVSRDQSVLNAKTLIFWPLDEPIHFTSKLAFKPFDKNVDRLVDYAQLHNPSLHTFHRQQELAQLAYEAAREPTRPTFAVNGSYADNEILYPSIVTHAWSWTAGMNWLFFDSFVTRDQTRSARIAQWVADLNYLNSQRATEVSVRNAYLDVKRTEKQIADFQFSREQAGRNVDIVRLRFRNGLDRLIDVFDAENQMRDLDNEYLNLLVSYNQAKDNLSTLIGADVETVR